jgi:hypothetical protein
LNILISKNDKNLPFHGLKTLLEERFGEILIIKNYEELNNYNLPLFPSEVSIIYYEISMASNNKYHHLIHHSKYSIIISEENWAYENVVTITIGFNQNFVSWFLNRTLNYFKEKYQLDLIIEDSIKKLIISWIISKRYDPLEFIKNFFFIGDFTKTVDYLEELSKNIQKIQQKTYETPFMGFYKLMMGNYGGKQTISQDKLLSYIVLFNNIHYN